MINSVLHIPGEDVKRKDNKNMNESKKECPYIPGEGVKRKDNKNMNEPKKECPYCEKTFVSPVTGTALTEEAYNSLFRSAAYDIADGKGRCDLLPLDIIGDFMDKPILKEIELFKETKNPDHLWAALGTFAAQFYENDWRTIRDIADGKGRCDLLPLGVVGENNWKKGIPLHCYIDSGVRHYLKWLRSDNDEPHDRAFVWNMLCALWTLKHKPELDDIDADIMDAYIAYKRNQVECLY